MPWFGRGGPGLFWRCMGLLLTAPRVYVRGFLLGSVKLMVRLLVVILAAGLLASCAGRNVGDYIPVWAGGLPNNAPPRPGTAEYDEYQRNLQVEAARDKSKDPPKPNADAPTPLLPSQAPASPPTR